MRQLATKFKPKNGSHRLTDWCNNHYDLRLAVVSIQTED